MRLVIGLSGLLISHSALAIVNIENLRMDESQAGFSTSTTLSVSGKRGNTDEDIYGLTGGMQYIGEDTAVRNLFLYDLKNSQSNGTPYSESYFVHYRHTRQLNTHWAWEKFIQHQSEPLSDKRERNLIGTNARYRLTTSPFNGHAGVGLMYEQRSVKPNNQLTEDKGVRFNLYLDSKYKLSENTDWKISLYAQPKVDAIADLRSVASTGLTTRINQRFAFTFDLAYSHDAKPLTAQKSYDLNYKTGINLRF
ncbi:DUF481 domain-containing protein [Thiomicrospira microaerophila]|uniref:DUF481 domain-containing protein n=1 Tax=Thiomicrospira microaerophila TaxID=406020 RepID=UPI0005CA8AF7|nr:DUF481 domain-containing protein [Thiomicrospira microaerophila]